MSNDTYDLADGPGHPAARAQSLMVEIDRLITTGATAKHCAGKPVLCELAGASGAARGFIAMQFLVAGVGSVHGPIYFEGTERSSDVMKRVYLILLALERGRYSLATRRLRAMDVLHVVYSEQTFRKDREQELCWILASHLVEHAS